MFVKLYFGPGQTWRSDCRSPVLKFRERWIQLECQERGTSDCSLRYSLRVIVGWGKNGTSALRGFIGTVSNSIPG